MLPGVSLFFSEERGLQIFYLQSRPSQPFFWIKSLISSPSLRTTHLRKVINSIRPLHFFIVRKVTCKLPILPSTYRVMNEYKTFKPKEEKISSHRKRNYRSQTPFYFVPESAALFIASQDTRPIGTLSATTPFSCRSIIIT